MYVNTALKNMFPDCFLSFLCSSYVYNLFDQGHFFFLGIFGMHLIPSLFQLNIIHTRIWVTKNNASSDQILRVKSLYQFLLHMAVMADESQINKYLNLILFIYNQFMTHFQTDWLLCICCNW
jgi:hypothetical protein